MNQDDSLNHRLSRIKFYILWGTVAWTVLMAASLLWNILYTKHQTLVKADVMARLAFEKDTAFRVWVTFHGGVYVPVTAETQSNPYLNVPEKDERLRSGKPVTLMNPAYVMRQYYERIEKTDSVKGHITSLKPLRPENRPDPWEEQSLQSFETGKEEATTIQSLGKTEYVRLMKPFITAKGCLKCHASQGYKEGEIRGGVSVSVPMAPLRILESNQIVMILGFHALFWGLGFAGIILSGKRILESEKERARAEEELKNTYEQVRSLASRLQEVREETRTQIAQDIHDELGGALAGLKMDLLRLEPIVSGEENREKKQAMLDIIYQSKELLNNTIRATRRIFMEQRPCVLDDFGLVAAMEWQLGEYKTHSGISFEFNAGQIETDIDKNVATVVFRIFQEALANVIRHSKATEVNISLRVDEGQLILEVKDNGRVITEDEISGQGQLVFWA